jgi:hypothetical protein
LPFQRRITLKLLLTLGTTFALMLALAACGEDPCEHLAETCAKCTDATVKAACQAIADADEHEACESNDATYDSMCE